MDEGVAAGVFAQLLSALDYCHDHNVYHRDLKLEKCAHSTVFPLLYRTLI
jgi:serine/threonine protein kinase